MASIVSLGLDVDIFVLVRNKYSWATANLALYYILWSLQMRQKMSILLARGVLSL